MTARNRIPNERKDELPKGVGSKRNRTPRKRKQEVEDEFPREVGSKEVRKLRARRQRGLGVLWSGLRMAGLVGWSVAVPTLIGVGVGNALDAVLPARFSWTLTFLLIGLCCGCFNAWYWVRRESRNE
jgi:ATP synthase protein I